MGPPLGVAIRLRGAPAPLPWHAVCPSGGALSAIARTEYRDFHRTHGAHIPALSLFLIVATYQDSNPGIQVQPNKKPPNRKKKAPTRKKRLQLGKKGSQLEKKGFIQPEKKSQPRKKARPTDRAFFSWLGFQPEKKGSQPEKKGSCMYIYIYIYI